MGQWIKCPLSDREVVDSSPGRAIPVPYTLKKMVPGAHSLVAGTGQYNVFGWNIRVWMEYHFICLERENFSETGLKK